MTTNNKNNTAMSEKPLHRGRGWGGSPTAMPVTPPHRGRGREGVFFNSNETLDMCDVRISENGKIVISTKSYHTAELERLGKPEKTIRGRVRMENQNFVFEPYAEASRRPTYRKKAVVGSTTIAVTDGNVKLSLVVARNYSKETLTRLIEAEIEEVIRRLKEDLYDAIVKTPSDK